MEDEYSDDYLRSCVNLYLRCIGYDFELLTKKQQQYILKAEESISNKFRVVHDAKNLLSSAKITGTGIEQDLGISHQTYYNNKVLMDYVDFRAKDFAKYKAPIKKTYSSDEVAVLKEEITALHQRDVEYQELKLQLADAMKHISRLTDQIDKKAQGIHYQFGIKPSKHKVIHLHKSLKIVSWNVNGFSSCVEKGFFDFFLIIEFCNFI